MEYEILDSTSDVQEVSFEDFVECWVKSQTRGYNQHNPVVYDNYLALSSPLPNKTGFHYTLIYDCKNSDTDNPYKCLYEMFNEYLIHYEKWVREDERYNIVELIKNIDKKGKEK
jgi:hypothetical protein